MRNIAGYFTLLVLFSPFLWKGTPGEVLAQDTLSNSVQENLENLTENSQNEAADYSGLIENLEYYKKHPINLNNTNKGQLLELGLLDEIQIESLLNHIDRNGKLISTYELQSIEGYDIQTIEKILPYIIVTDITEDIHVSLKDVIKHGNHEIILRGQQVLEKQKGFSLIDSAGICKNPDSRYIGSPQKIYSRYRFNYGNNISAGITAEKDPGELFFKNNNRYNYPLYNSLLNGKQKNGFDFYSVHLFIKNMQFIKALALGDYQITFGQGLTAWSGLALGKSSDAMSIKRNSNTIHPHTSADENRFMRGCAISTGTDQFQATGFFSSKKIDANVIPSDTTNSTLTVSSLQETGLHTTPGEISDKGAIKQTVFGGNISYRKRKYSLGITGMHTQFDLNINPSHSPYNQFALSGNELTNAGADYSVLLHNFNFFGEASFSSNTTSFRSDRNGIAFLNGCIISLDRKLALSILHRNYQRNFQSLSANAFTENSIPCNEQGFYFGINAKPTNSISIHAYYDHFTCPWLKYQVNSPSDGNEFLIQLDYVPSKKLETYIRIKQKDKFVNHNSSNTDTADEIDFISPYRQTNYHWQIGYQISSSLKLSNRIEFISINKEAPEDGYLIYQDVYYRKMGGKFSITMRYALFDTQSFNSRIYTYENDIPGSYSIPSYYNKGTRIYGMVNYNITHNIGLWLRWSQTYYSNLNIISQGTLNEIQGHTKNEIKVEMKLSF